MKHTITLEGIILNFTPKEGGTWVYRELPDGRLLRIELTDEEYRQIRKADADARNERRRLLLKEAENHPLNQEALSLLRIKGEPPFYDMMPVLQLAMRMIAEGDEDCDECQWIETANRSHPENVLDLLERELPDGLSSDPDDAAEMILRALKPLDTESDLR